jgi:hypothetical integral membrane protein (TIGR02206 family)
LRQFSPEHISALSVLAAAVGASVWVGRHGSRRAVVWWGRGLALIILAGWIGEYVADAVLGVWSVKYTLPFQLTDAVSLVSILALWTREQLLVELTYFWALTASLQAALTPDLSQTFPSVFYFTYFTYHVGAIVAACFLVFGRGLYPRRGAVWRVYGITLACTALAATADLITGGNYMYLRDKPVHSSLLSVMGPWPWYIVATSVLALALLLVVNALTNLARPRITS